MTTMFILVDPHNRWSIVDDLPRPLDAAIERRDEIRAGNRWAMLQPVPHVHPEEEEATFCMIYVRSNDLVLFDGELTPNMRHVVGQRWADSLRVEIAADYDI
jgi:hypothetical protein